MKKQMQIFLSVSMLAISSLFAEEIQTAEGAALTAQSMDIAKISEAFGHVISKNLENIGVKFEMAKVIQGLKDASEGKTAPMSEMECIQAIAAVQEKIFKEQCTENLRRAEKFLSDNAKAEGVVALDEGKVQYRVMEAGNGAVVESHFSPLIKYTGKYLDGSVFGTSKEEELISLDEVIPGLKDGLLGMKEGEKRTVYIHPDLAYGTNGYLPPNSLLTFEVEVVKANAPIKEAADSDVEKPQARHEIAELKTDIR